jgi:hypothetical protein
MDQMRRRVLIAGSMTALSIIAVNTSAGRASSAVPDSQFAVTHTDTQWRKLLIPRSIRRAARRGYGGPLR